MSSAKMSLRFCANLSFMFQENSSLLERYHLAKSSGFQAIECAFPYDFSVQQVVDAKRKAGVEQVLINAYPGDWSKGERGLASVLGKRAEFKESIEKSVKYAKALDCKRIHIMAGVVENETEEHMNEYISNLKVAESILRENDIIGVIEPINEYALPKYFMNNFEKGLNVVKKINSPNLKLQLDIFHLQHICGNLTKNINKLLPYVGHIQIAQVPDRHEPDTPGEIDFRYLFSILETEQYEGWIGLEYIPKDSTVEGLKWIRRFGYSL